MIERHHHFHIHGPSEREIAGIVAAAISPIMSRLMTISQEVQNVLDKAKQNGSLVQSVDLGLKALQAQVGDLQKQIDSLKANQTLSDDDKAALVEAGNDLAASITTLQSDIPANTDAPQPSNTPAT